METTTLQQRIAEFMEKQRALNIQRRGLLKDVGNAIADRLTYLYENRDRTRWRSEVTFERWLSASIEYDNYYVSVIFDKDPELNELCAFARNNDPYYVVPEAVNARLGEAGRTLGVNSQLTNTEHIGRDRHH